MDFSEALKIVSDEIAATVGRVDPAEWARLADAVVGARRILLTGQGRSGLVARAFAMRLAHLGLAAEVVGESTTTAIGKGDLLVAISCSGTTGVTCLVARNAKAAGAARACVTGNRRSRLSRMSDTVAIIPAPSKHHSGGRAAQFGSTRFEQCCLILLDALCLMLMDRLGQSPRRMMARHSNLE